MKKLIIVFMLAIGLFSTYSCSKDEVISQEVDPEDMARKLKFQSISSQLAADSVNGTHSIESMSTRGGSVDILIFSFRIAREKYDCKKGFGICDFKWGWENISSANNSIDDKYVVSSYLRSTPTGKYYVSLPIDQKLSSEEIQAMPALVVDELLERMEMINSEKKQITIEKGNYQYNPSVGENGGFNVPVNLGNKSIIE